MDGGYENENFVPTLSCDSERVEYIKISNSENPEIIISRIAALYVYFKTGNFCRYIA